MDAVRNYQKELDKIIDKIAEQKAAWTTGGMSAGMKEKPMPPELFFAQLLCAMQQLCVGIPSGIFQNHGILL